MTRLLSAVALTASLLATPLLAGDTPSPAGAAVYFIGLEDGAELTNPVMLRFGLSGMGIAPAGYEVDDTGHHHLLINMTLADVDQSDSMPATDQLKHFGGGQTEVTLDLPAGEHSLQLVLGDFTHTPHNPPVASDVVNVTVK